MKIDSFFLKSFTKKVTLRISVVQEALIIVFTQYSTSSSPFLLHNCISTLPGGYCGCRSYTPPLRAPSSARLVGAVQQGELSQLLLSDLVIVVLRETKYSMSQKQGHLSSDCNRCSQQQQMSPHQNYLDTHGKHMAALSVEYSMKSVFFWLCSGTKWKSHEKSS